MINVSEALDFDLCESISVQRTSSGEYIDGIYQEGTKSFFNSIASIQQPSDEDIKYITEAEKTTDLRLIICKDKLQTSNKFYNTIADNIICDAGTYKIIAVKDYSKFGHTTCIGTKIAN